MPFYQVSHIFSGPAFCPASAITKEEYEKHDKACIVEIDPDAVNMTGQEAEEFVKKNYPKVVRCVAEKVGLVGASGRINPQERQKRRLVSSCTEWDQCWADNDCAVYKN